MVDVPQFLILILTSISVYLQFQQLTFSAGLTLGALLGGLIGAIFTGLISILKDNFENNRKRHDDLIKTYSRLKGEKHVLAQLYSNVSSYAIYIENNEVLANFLKTNKYVDVSLANERRKKLESEELKIKTIHDEALIDLTKYMSKWWKDLTLIEVYSDNPQLSIYIKKYTKNIEDSVRAIEMFEESLASETKTNPFGDIVGQINPIWQTKKEMDLKVLINSLEASMEETLNKIDIFIKKE